jgi:hypothetical protein
VRILGQSAFIGYSVVELSETPPESLEVSLDGALLGGEVEEVGTYLVVASNGPVATDALGYGILQVPSAGDAALPQWWDSLAEPEEEPVPEPAPAPAPAPAPEAEPGPVVGEFHEVERSDRVDGVEAKPSRSQPEPEPAPPPIDLLAYTDSAGGRVSRWRWPRQG